MSFEFKEYLDLLYAKKFDEASMYRRENMPRKIYKYVSLSNNVICNKKNEVCYQNNKLNEDKLRTFKENKIWFSRFDNLNDPFEYKVAYIDYEKLKVNGFNKKIADLCFNSMRNMYLISSFTNNVVDNMPMWAHYSNNHEGFCIEYDVLNTKMIYPISYEGERIGIANILSNLIAKCHQLEKGEIDESDKEYQMYLTLIMHFATVKHNSWAYEKEYRVLYCEDYEEGNIGQCISSTKVGLMPNKIFIGYRCSEANRNKLVEIAKLINVHAYEMYLDDKEYKLKYRLI